MNLVSMENNEQRMTNNTKLFTVSKDQNNIHASLGRGHGTEKRTEVFMWTPGPKAINNKKALERDQDEACTLRRSESSGSAISSSSARETEAGMGTSPAPGRGNNATLTPQPSVAVSAASLSRAPNEQKKRGYPIFLSNIPENADVANIFGAIRAKIGKFKSCRCQFLGDGVCKISVRKQETRDKLLEGSVQIFGVQTVATMEPPNCDNVAQSFVPVYLSNIPSTCTVKKLMGMVKKSVGEFVAMNKVVIEEGRSKITFNYKRHQELLLEKGLAADLADVRISATPPAEPKSVPGDSKQLDDSSSSAPSSSSVAPQKPDRKTLRPAASTLRGRNRVKPANASTAPPNNSWMQMIRQSQSKRKSSSKWSMNPDAVNYVPNSHRAQNSVNNNQQDELGRGLRQMTILDAQELRRELLLGRDVISHPRDISRSRRGSRRSGGGGGRGPPHLPMSRMAMMDSLRQGLVPQQMPRGHHRGSRNMRSIGDSVLTPRMLVMENEKLRMEIEMLRNKNGRTRYHSEGLTIEEELSLNQATAPLGREELAYFHSEPEICSGIFRSVGTNTETEYDMDDHTSDYGRIQSEPDLDLKFRPSPAEYRKIMEDEEDLSDEYAQSGRRKMPYQHFSGRLSPTSQLQNLQLQNCMADLDFF